MESKTALKTRTARTGAGLKVSAAKTQQVEKKIDLKECLKFLNGDIHLVDINAISEEFLLKPHLGDHMQYELHKYCQKGPGQTNASTVKQLAVLCYSHVSVSHFSNMDRFVGCVYYICSYLLKTENYKEALEVVSSLDIKEKEINEASREKPDIRNFLCNLHSSFMSSAVVLASKVPSKTVKNYPVCMGLAKASLNVLGFIKVPQREIGKKLLKTSKLFLQSLRDFLGEDVRQFYNKLRDVLKTLIPVFCDLGYFLFYLHKMDQLKNVDNTKGMDVYDVLRRTVRLFSLLVDLPPKAQFSFDALLCYFFTSYEDTAFSEEHLNDLEVVDSCKETYFLLLSVIFSHGIQRWWNFITERPQSVSAPLIGELFKKMFQLYEIHYRSSVLYCWVNCPYETCFGDLLNGNLQKIQYTIRLCFKNKVAEAVSLVPVSRSAFKLAMQCLEYTSSMQCCKEQRIYSWKHSVIHHTNLVEDILRQPSSTEAWIHLKDCSAEILKEIVNSRLEPPYDFKRVKRWHYSCLKLENFSEALLVCIHYYLCYPQEVTEIASMWLQTKSESSNDIFQEMTVSDVMKTRALGISDFARKRSSADSLKPLLLMELKAYSTCSPETFQSPKTYQALANRIWKQLEKCQLDTWEKSLAVSCFVVTTICEEKTLPAELQYKCGSLVKELMSLKKEGRMQCRSLLHAANLRFCLFLYNVRLAEGSAWKTASSDLVLGYLKKAEEEKVKFGDDVDVNLTCNVIPSSSNLTVELETNYIEELNGIVDLWQGALRKGLRFEDFPTVLEFDSWLRNVQQVAQMYELVGEHQRAFATWLLSYRIAKVCGDSAAVLSGLSHLLRECSDVDKSEMVAEAESISGKLASENRERHVVVEYWLAIAGNHLRNRKFEKCLEHLSKAKKTVESLGSSVRTYALTARLWCLVSQLISIHSECEAVFGFPNAVDVRITAFKAFGYANAGGRSNLIKSATRSECVDLVLSMIEVNTWAYHLHGVYRQTDFMRFFLDELYQIVQKLFLPTRTAEMLVRLAEVDVLCEKTSDCERKVAKLKSILTTLSVQCEEGAQTEKPASYLKVPRGGGDFEVPSPRPISPARFLSKPASSREADLSPIRYHLQDAKAPKATEHLRKCKCRLCQNLLVQMLTVDTLRVEGEIHNMQNSYKKAATFYNLAHDTLNRLTQVRAEQSEILRLELEAAFKAVPGSTGLDFQLAAVQFHTARFLISYAFFEAYALRAVTDNVAKTTAKVSTLMKRFAHEEKLLTWAFMELKFFCVVLTRPVDVKLPRKSTPVQYKTATGTATATKTPFVAKTCAAPSVAAKTRPGKMPKSPNPCAQKGKKLSEEETDSDPINTAFIGAEKLEIDRKVGRKLSFRTNEPATNTKLQTVKKAPRERPPTIKPRKLNLDEGEDPTEGKTARKAKKPVAKGKA